MLPDFADQHLNPLTGDRRFDEMLLSQIIHPGRSILPMRGSQLSLPRLSSHCKAWNACRKMEKDVITGMTKAGCNMSRTGG